MFLLLFFHIYKARNVSRKKFTNDIYMLCTFVRVKLFLRALDLISL
jgi:hypothetical protein